MAAIDRPADHLAVNQALWDRRAPAHAASPEYGLDRFRTDPAHLSDVVGFDRPRLGDVSGLDGVHLQCHIGTDTVSLARLGARMSGLDLSGASLEQARRLAADLGLDVPFVQADVEDAVAALGGERFDLVYTGIGALCWLPRVDRWAAVVAGLLRPGGRLFLREAHPVLWALDLDRADALVVDLPYFEQEQPQVWHDEGSYVTTPEPLPAAESREWNHGLGEIVTALLEQGLRLTMLVEHDSVPYRATAVPMVADDHGEWRLAERPERMPLSYTLQAVRDG